MEYFSFNLFVVVSNREKIPAKRILIPLPQTLLENTGNEERRDCDGEDDCDDLKRKKVQLMVCMNEIGRRFICGVQKSLEVA